MRKKKNKSEVIAKFKTHPKDTGSSEVQIGILTREINELVRHLKKHKHDFSCRRGLLKKVAKRRKLLRWLEREDAKKYERVIKKLKL